MLLISFSTAQITIPQSGLSNLLTAGKSFYYNISDSAPRPVNIGKRGGPNVYDFNGYNIERTGISRVYGVGGIPTLAARFPAQAITFGSAPDTIENSPVFLYSADTLFVIGEASLVTRRRFKHIRPYEPMAIFPVTYQSSRTYSHTHYDTTYNASGSVAATNVYSGSDSVTVDGFGTLKILGRQFECLRVKLNHFTFSDKEFMYLTREGVFLNVFMASSQKDTGLVQPMSIMALMPSSIVSVDEQVHMPTDYTLNQNYPNPFNPTTAISYQLPALSGVDGSALTRVDLSVFDVLGRQVTTLVSGLRPAGAHVVRWDGNNERGERMPSGMYLYRLTVGSSEVTKKMILLK
jgi:hypothetical protein